MLNKNKLIVAAILAVATASESKAQWNLNGNTGITTTNWLGTINNVPLTFKTNNTFHTIFNNNGTVGIGLSNPIDKLHLHGTAICNGQEGPAPEDGDLIDEYCVGLRLTHTNTGSGTMDGFSVKLLGANTLITAWENNASISFLTQAGSINFNQRVLGQTYKRLGVHGNGNVYVGNVTPSAKLHVKSESTSDWLGFFENNTFDSKGLKIKTGKFGSANAGNILELGTDKNGSYFPVFLVNAKTGNVGINTVNPSATLHLTSESEGWTAIFENNNLLSEGVKIVSGERDAGNAGNVLEAGTNNSGNYYKLFAVNAKSGITFARELIVDLEPNWPDYVFNENYKILTFKELEEYIALNKRLPGIESAEQIKENGINVGLTQAKLLEKIEELTLMLIDLNKKVEILEKGNLK